MRKPRGYRNHDVAPHEWRRTSNMTGDYEMDASIQRCKNASVPGKLEHHICGGGNAYGNATGYDGYENYK